MQEYQGKLGMEKMTSLAPNLFPLGFGNVVGAQGITVGRQHGKGTDMW